MRHSSAVAALVLLAALAASFPRDARAQSAPDTAVWVHPIGRLFLDGAAYREGKKPMSNGTELRKIRVGAAGGIGDDWLFEVEFDAADDDFEVKDAWIARRVGSLGLLRFGNFKEPFSLEELTSSRFISFLERGLPNAFAPGRAIGVSGTLAMPRVWVSAGVFGQDVDEVGEAELGESEGWGVTGRVVGRWGSGETGLLHVGASATRRVPDARVGGEGRVRFRTYSASHVDRVRFLNTGHIKGVDHHSVVGLEGAAQLRSLVVQGEYMRARVTPLEEGQPVATFHGAYVSATWFPFGGRRVYDPFIAEFGPNRAEGGLRDVEVALRYGTLDLNDPVAGVEGGTGEAWTAGLNWYLTPRMRVMANYAWLDHGPLADADGDFEGDDDYQVLGVRFQVWF